MPIDASVVGKSLPDADFAYGPNEVMLYALGVGAGAEADELKFVYENQLETLPSFCVLPSLQGAMGMISVMSFNPMMLLHGEQAFVLHKPIPIEGKLTSSSKVKAVYDKGKGAVIVLDVKTRDEKGQPVFDNTFTAFVRGEGGFGGERGPSEERNVPPSRPADATVEQKTLPQQAALYRLTGDRNPLHIDPQLAQMVGYPKPILHGLCTYGHVVRAVLRQFCGNDVTKFKSFDARFKGVVYPGETIVSQMWKEGNKVIVQSSTKERGEPVLTNAAATIG